MFTSSNNTAEAHRLRALQFYDKSKKDFAYGVSLGISNLGRAQEVEDKNQIAYVAIHVDDPIKDFKLYLNSEKFDGFSDEEAAGVVWHELGHILNKHLGMRAEDKTLGMDNEKLLLIAKEIVCNDAVLHHKVNLPMVDDLFHGEKILGENTFPKNTKQVYDMLVDKFPEDDEQAQQELNDMLNGGDGTGDGDSDGHNHGNCGGGTIVLVDADGNHVSMGDSDEEAQQKAQDILDQMDEDGTSLDEMVDNASENMDADEVADAVENGPDQDDTDNSSSSSSSSRGNGQGDGDSTIRGLKIEDAISSPKEWMNFLREIDPKIDVKRMYAQERGMSKYSIHESDWVNKPRYMHSLGRNRGVGRLPSTRPARDPRNKGDNLKPSIIFAVDQSGSIGEKYAQAVLNLAMTVPQNMVNVKMCVYASNSSEVDMNTKNFSSMNHQIGFGTEFSAIDKFVMDSGLDYDNTTIVNFTDGEAHFGGYSYGGSGVPSNIHNYVFVDVFTRNIDQKPFSSNYYGGYNWEGHNVRTFPIQKVYSQFLDAVK